ncbi:putative tail fiber protein [Acinetobacter phage vB_AbaM_Acibel004]|uniref:tail fiber protein n=1 Tax=Acinetobacter phage vB_AbaM_Acibel004 TaxID=1481186 RepID=UPI0004E84378|nr:tail fiber protein [Acinetobacter phage vB_AbaM_Acibel004]AHY26763.1 putative tail fiber protein [Acinetobacter phage vB_AbaM_Acibel004]
MSKVLTGNETVSIVGNFAKSKATLKEIASFAVVDGGVTEEFVTEAVKPKADKVYVDAELSKKANASALNKAGVGLGNVDNTSDANKPVSTAQKTALDLKADKTALDLKADKTSLNKSGVGLGNVDNTADSAKPVSTAQKSALDKKVDLAGLLKTIEATPAIVHTGEGEIDCHKLDYGQHLIRSDNAINAPPDTKITLLYVVKTHDEVGSGGIGQVLKPSDFEQGTISESSSVGTDYELAKYPPTEPLHGSRIRSIKPIPITEFSTVSVAEGFEYSVLAFDENQKYLGRSSFMVWSGNPRLTYPNAKFIAVAVKKVGQNVPITPEEATQAKLTVTTLGQTSGGSKLLIAWGATMGDLHTCVNISGAWSSWSRIGSVIPKDANEGDHLVFRSGKWVAEAPKPTV